jgi:hypothetical protein
VRGSVVVDCRHGHHVRGDGHRHKASPIVRGMAGERVREWGHRGCVRSSAESIWATAAKMLRRYHLGGTMRVATGLSMAACMATLGCSSATAPPPRPTMLVTNAVCAVGPCRTLVIAAFIWAWEIPQPPGGIRTLGYVRGATTCLQFPAKWTIEVGQEGGPLHQLTWTPNNPAGIFLLAWDSALVAGTGTPGQADSANNGLWPYIGPGGTDGATPTFVPGNAAGWSVTFPPTSRSGTAEPSLTPTTACPSAQQPPPQPQGP